MSSAIEVTDNSAVYPECDGNVLHILVHDFSYKVLVLVKEGLLGTLPQLFEMWCLSHLH